MRLLRTHVGTCPTHPTAAKRGDQDGGIRCGVCDVEIGQWNLPWQPLWAIAAENVIARTVSLALPQSVVRWVLKRAIAHATQPRWGDTAVQSPATITADFVILRWELRTPPRRLPSLPEWAREYMNR